MNEQEYIIELTKQLVQAKDKETRLYIRSKIDSATDYVNKIDKLDNIEARIHNLESKASFSSNARS